MSNQAAFNFRRPSPYGDLRKVVHPIADQAILAHFQNVLAGKAISYLEGMEVLTQFTSTYAEWIMASRLNQIKELAQFPQRLITNAVTHSLDSFHFRHRARRLRFFIGEYPYNVEVLAKSGLSWEWLEKDNLQRHDAVIISYPFSATGKKHLRMDEILQKCVELKVPVLVDMAYFGTCVGVELDLSLPCIESVAFSLSKPMGLPALRVGVEFTKNPLPALQIVNEWGMVNRLSAYIGTRLLQEFSADYIPNKYTSVYKLICAGLNLEPTNVVLMGLGGEEYNEFSRMGVANRVGLNMALKQTYETSHNKEVNSFLSTS